ncbi:uncharacterized protein I206_102236 [Kwoniella pini CBS 10737]|uniref:DNA polymerase delta subunit 3 n=1 Tax=Kwoniella pini CBS 10737 TaxID=1296096 RepID=A0A1B9HSY8_9TREE|nr:uncharacterized protein I206_07604 [Kwoniella pini CBS 10737]OCF46371.1 hypothetical protein I206_07604 [Kwoniella pini CBS 10737]
MATPEQQKIATRKLTQWIENDKRIVTYRDISREIKCHVNIAKNLLLNHYQNNSKLIPTYLLTGPLLLTSKINQTQLFSLNQNLNHNEKNSRIVKIVDMDEMSDDERNSEHDNLEEEEEEEQIGNDLGNNNENENGLIGSIKLSNNNENEEEEMIIKNQNVIRWGVILVQSDQIEEKKKLFEIDTLSIHIHSLAPSLVNDPAQYLIPNLTLREYKNYHDPLIYGTISGETLRPTVPLTADKKDMKDGKMDWSGSKKVASGLGEGSKKEDLKKKEESKKVEEKKKIPINSTSASSNKIASQEVKSTSTPTGSLSSKKKRVIHSDTEEDEPISNPPSTSKKLSLKKEPTSSMVRADDQIAMEAMMSMDMEVDFELSDNNETPKKNLKLKKEEENQLKNKIRKKRRVKKSKTIEDKKGRMVTRDYSTDESYTASEEEGVNKNQSKSIITTNSSLKARDSSSSIGSNDTTKKNPTNSGPSSHPPPNKKAVSGSAKGQSTLKGFFTKK